MNTTPSSRLAIYCGTHTASVFALQEAEFNLLTLTLARGCIGVLLTHAFGGGWLVGNRSGLERLPVLLRKLRLFGFFALEVEHVEHDAMDQFGVSRVRVELLILVGEMNLRRCL